MEQLLYVVHFWGNMIEHRLSDELLLAHGNFMCPVMMDRWMRKIFKRLVRRSKERDVALGALENIAKLGIILD